MVALLNNIFVTGASGFVGRSFITFILKNHPDVKIRVISRSKKADENIKQAAADGGLLGVNEGENEKLKIFRGDLSDLEALKAAMQDCEVVFHSAAKCEFFGDWEEFVKINIDGTKNVLEVAKASGVKRFIQISTEATCVRKRDKNSDLNTPSFEFEAWAGIGNMVNLTEDSPTAATNPPPFYAPYSVSKAQAEQVLLQADEEKDGIKVVILRPRFIWGNNDTTVLAGFVTAIKTGQFMWTSPSFKSSTCHIENLCEGMVLAATHPSPSKIYFLADTEPSAAVDFRDFITRYIATQNIEVPTSQFSIFWMWRLASLMEYVPFLNKSKYVPEALNKQIFALIGHSVVVNDAKARKELNYSPKISIEKGLESMTLLKY